ncbi:MAG: O-antigen ligase family protein, partial [Thermoplasmata archaeon]
YLVLLSVNSLKHIKVFISLLLIATSVVCLISLQYYSSGRLGSLVLRNPNSFGNFLAIVIPFSVSLFVFGRFERDKKLLIACSLILMFISLVFTFSRSAWFGVIASILLLCVLKPRAPLFLLIFGIISGVFLFSPVKKRVFKDLSDPGAQYRIIKAKIALDKFKENPLLGSGLGSFHYEAQFSELWAYRAHSTLENNYLVLLAEGGLIEFFAFLYLIIMLGKKVLSLLKRIQDPFLYAILFGCAASIISTMSAGLFEDTLFFPKNNWLIGIFIGIVIIVERIYEESLIAAKTAGVEAEGKEQPFQIKES